MKSVTKKSLEKKVERDKIFLMHSLAGKTQAQKAITWSLLWSGIRILLHKIFHRASYIEINRKNHSPLYRIIIFLSSLIIILYSIFLIEAQRAEAAEAHITYSASVTLPYSVSTFSSTNQNKATTPNWRFPCSDQLGSDGIRRPNVNIIEGDWLTDNVPQPSGPGQTLTGHLIYTYPADTYALPQIRTLFGYTQALGFLLITPIVILLGYQIMMAVSVFRYAGTLEGLSRVLLGILAVAVSLPLVQMLISLENTVTTGIVLLHAKYPYPSIDVSGMPVPYKARREPALAYWGIVMPMTRWGCAINHFIGIFSKSFVEDTLASMIPILSGLTHLAGAAETIPNLIWRICQMIRATLSILLWLQVFIRIVFLNYYIVTGPLAFGCWALPGGVGQNVVRLWCKGFITLLFVQVIQLFILTTLPLLLPTLPQYKMEILQDLLTQFPPILVLCVVLKAPQLMGASMRKILGTAHLMTGRTFTAVRAAASQAM